MLSGPTLRLIAMGYGVQFSRLSDGYHIAWQGWYGVQFLVQFSFKMKQKVHHTETRGACVWFFLTLGKTVSYEHLGVSK